MLDLDDLISKHGGQNSAARALGVPLSTFKDTAARDGHVLSSPPENKHRYIITSAIAGAPLHRSFWNNLMARAASLRATVVVAPIYNGAARRRGLTNTVLDFPAELRSYIVNKPIDIGSLFRFCPELDILSTMVDPLSGLNTYTKHRWGIFPHPKVRMETVATHKGLPAKHILTTGAATLPAYSDTKSGHKAKFDHIIGAVVVESDPCTGLGWYRHITATSNQDGSFYDLDTYVTASKVTFPEGGTAAGLVLGDIHTGSTSPDVLRSLPGLMTCLRPRNIVLHDLVDFHEINYHELTDAFSSMSRYPAGLDSTKRALADFMLALSDMCKGRGGTTDVHVVASNHDAFVRKWLNSVDFRKVPSSQKKDYLELARYLWVDTTQSVLEKITLEALDDELPEGFRLHFLDEDESLKIKRVECGWHGHHGPNGSRAAKKAFVAVTEKAVIGHIHSPRIDSGLYVVGTSSNLDMGYNKGPSGWAHTHCVIYNNGTRTLLNMNNGRYWG